MKFSVAALSLLSTVALSEAGTSLRGPSNADGEANPTRVLKKAADAAKFEAAYLTEAAEHQATDEHKAAIKAAAEEAHYEARVLAEAVEAESPEEHDRLLKEKTLPNGISCRMCPDDDNYFWPDDWTLQHGWPH
eukprot:scaffold3987_cov134-Cylindrotheca_fusiformis.AAC.21